MYKEYKAYGLQIIFQGNKLISELLVKNSALINQSTKMSLVGVPTIFIYFVSTYQVNDIENKYCPYTHVQLLDEPKPTLTDEEKHLKYLILENCYCLTKKPIWIMCCDEC